MCLNWKEQRTGSLYSLGGGGGGGGGEMFVLVAVNKCHHVRDKIQNATMASLFGNAYHNTQAQTPTDLI